MNNISALIIIYWCQVTYTILGDFNTWYVLVMPGRNVKITTMYLKGAWYLEIIGL